MKLTARIPMTTLRGTGSRSITAVLGIAIVFLASSCGQSTSSAIPPTPSAASTSTPQGSPPPGGPVPAQLLGNWILHTPNLDPQLALSGLTNGKLLLALTQTTYRVLAVNNNPHPASVDAGSVVVNNNEIDFFSEISGEPFCHPQLPDGVGRYTWTLTGGVLHFTMISDPCGRIEFADQTYIRTS